MHYFRDILSLKISTFLAYFTKTLQIKLFVYKHINTWLYNGNILHFYKDLHLF